MVKICPGYTESMDVVAEKKFVMKDHVIAIQRSVVKNSHYEESLKEVSKNPYTEVAEVITELIRYKEGD